MPTVALRIIYAHGNVKIKPTARYFSWCSSVPPANIRIEPYIKPFPSTYFIIQYLLTSFDVMQSQWLKAWLNTLQKHEHEDRRKPLAQKQRLDETYGYSCLGNISICSINLQAVSIAVVLYIVSNEKWSNHALFYVTILVIVWRAREKYSLLTDSFLCCSTIVLPLD
jgi:hypothetical protein